MDKERRKKEAEEAEQQRDDVEQELGIDAEQSESSQVDATPASSFDIPKSAVEISGQSSNISGGIPYDDDFEDVKPQRQETFASAQTVEVQVDHYSHEGKKYFKSDDGKLYSVDGEFRGRVIDGVPDFDALDSSSGESESEDDENEDENEDVGEGETPKNKEPSPGTITQDSVGKRLKIFWEEEDEWFEGVVEKITPEGAKILYDDGDDEVIDPLSDGTVFEWL